MRAIVIAVVATVALLQTAAATPFTLGTEEWAALVDLYIATNGSYWSDNTG